ncbi:MAG: hypothetical protein J7501_06685 [Bdellovibrio sp.]|nr:hypothetical protein [Bdellovibrio sp.]
MSERIFAAVGFVIALAGCTSLSPRAPSSVVALNPVVQSLQGLQEQFVKQPVTAENCEALLNDVGQAVTALAWDPYSNEDLKAGGASILNHLWDLRLATHQNLPTMSTKCVLQTRSLFHVIREHEDYVGDFVYSAKALDPAKIDFQKQPVPIFDRSSYAPYLVRQDVDDSKFQFHSGDLMLARGISFFSAIISQISDNKSEFSHVVFMNQDERSGKINTVESYIGSGVDSYEINFALKNENARLLVLRPKDAALGKVAARDAMISAEKKIGYDYKMDFADYSKMSCVEVVRAAYDRASQGQVVVPQNPANIQISSKDFLDKLGMRNGEMITPDDLEVDPRFDLVLDWRDYRIIRDSRYKDAILNEMIRWVNELRYEFHDTTKSLIAKNILLPSRSTRLWPLVQKLTGSPNLDPNLPKQTLGVMLVLNQIGESLLNQVTQADNDYIAKLGRPMTNMQLRQTLNKLREEDLARFKRHQRTSIHYALRPPMSIWR